MAIGTFRRAACAAASAAALTAGLALPAQAAAPGWRQVDSKQYGAGNLSDYGAVAALSAKNIWVLGGTDDENGFQPTGTPVAVHWNGARWAGYPMPAGVPGGIGEVSAVSATDIWAVTRYGGYVLHFNGARWSVAKHLPEPQLVAGSASGITAFGPANVWVFGEGRGAIGALGTWHYDGHTWKRWQGNAAGLVTASALSPANIWAVGSLKVPFGSIEHFNGHRWLPVTAAALSGLSFADIHAVSATNVWVAAGPQPAAFKSFLLHYGPHARWSKISVPWPVTAAHVSPDGRGGLWVTGESKAGQVYAMHRTAAGVWSRFPIGGWIWNLARVPGMTSMAGAGFKGAGAKSGSDAVIWAYGKL